MLWLGIYFPNLRVEIESKELRALKKEHHKLPLVIRDNNCVVSTNNIARKLGISKGISAATAYSILPQAIYREQNILKEMEYLRTLAATFYEYTPSISVHGSSSILLEAEGSINLFNGADNFLKYIEKKCASLKHEATIKIAKTPLEALLLAESQETCIEDVSLYYIDQYIPREDKNQKNLCERLSEIGVKRIGELLHFPRKELGYRFGKEIVHFLSELIDGTDTPQKNVLPLMLFDEKIELPYSISEKNNLEPVLARLLEKLEHWLFIRKKTTNQIIWYFSSSEKNKKKIIISFSKNQFKKANSLKLTMLKLEQTSLHPNILSVRLQINNLINKNELTRHFFEKNKSKSMHPYEMIDFINARLGDNRCSRLITLCNHLPEKSWKAVQHNKIRKNIIRDFVREKEEFSKRPLWILKIPKKINLQDFHLLEGPERINEEQCSISNYRDYYIAKHKNGNQCWVYKNIQAHWYLHGYF